MLRSIVTSIVNVAGVTSAYAPVSTGHLVNTSADIQEVFQRFGLSWNFHETGFVYVKLNAAPGVGKSITFTALDLDRTGSNPIEGQSLTISDLETTGVFGLDPEALGPIQSGNHVSYSYFCWKITGSASHGVSVARISIAADRSTFMRTPGPNWEANAQYQGFQGFRKPGTVARERWQMVGVDCKQFTIGSAFPYGESGTGYFFKNDPIYPARTVVFGSGAGGAAGAFDATAGDIFYQQITPDTLPFKALGESDLIPVVATEFPVCAGFNPVLTIATPQYVSLFADDSSGTTESDHQVVIPCGCVVDRMIVKVPFAPGTGKSFTLTVRKNGVDTGLIATISGKFETQGFDITHLVTFAPGDLASVRVNSAGNPGTPGWIAFGMRLVALTGGGSLPSDIAIQAPVGATIIGNIYTVAPASTSTFWGISGDVSVQGKPNTTITGDISIAPLPSWSILADIHVIRQLNAGTGWDGPWYAGDNS